MMEENLVLEAIAREMQTGVLVLDPGGGILYSNPFLARCFSIIGDIRGKKIDAVIRDSDFIKAVEVFLKDRGKTPYDGLEINEDGRFFNIRMVPVKEGGDFNLMLFLREITEEKRVETLKKDFVANVSHELRTPLASIKGYAETLLDGGMDDRTTLKEFLRVIDKHANRMSRLIDDLLVLSRLESHEMPMVREPVDMRELVSSVAEGVKKQAADKGIRLSMSLDENLPKVASDRGRIEQVMLNLLDNAIKYTPADGMVNVKVSSSGTEIRVDVKDTGIGIPPGDIPRIFERFYRVDKARSRDLGGTGLGLAIVKHIIHSLNGRVWVDSAPSKGSTFSFTLKPAC
ncbi:MAG: PAS domain-containing sensor histidine kinase [Deltaproteobacteria bacterium]|nr:PAS domain-containing sensor histidine kinase [Deltaproteobacteria bacterium]